MPSTDNHGHFRLCVVEFRAILEFPLIFFDVIGGDSPVVVPRKTFSSQPISHALTSVKADRGERRE